MTVTIGWWAIPAAITLVTIGLAMRPERETGYAVAVVGAFQLMGAIIVSLAAWLVWALLR